MELSMFFQETTPDTSGYMIAGFAITFIVMALYVASIYWRARNLNQDMTMLEEVDQPTSSAQAANKSAKL
jgi:CHASE3 domain sensor protein